LRKLYTGSYENFIHSIFRSDCWHDVTGGKSGAGFFKSSDEKYIFKVVKINELKMFREIGLGYFEYLCKSFFHYCPTALAKILGAFKIKMKYVSQNKTTRYCLFVMENILLGVNDDNCSKYDLKGSKRKRFTAVRQKG
jgi:1-phosphatidylinositol-3-phosphate 5-kinase